VISVVLQSFVSIAAPIENHQIDIEHIQSEHKHADDAQLMQKSDSNEDTTFQIVITVMAHIYHG
jgi:hypothetical protein